MQADRAEERLATLFAKTEEDLDAASDKAQKGSEDPYTSVNEGLTTDTAVTTDMDGDAVRRRGEGG